MRTLILVFVLLVALSERIGTTEASTDASTSAGGGAEVGTTDSRVGSGSTDSGTGGTTDSGVGAGSTDSGTGETTDSGTNSGTTAGGEGESSTAGKNNTASAMTSSTFGVVLSVVSVTSVRQVLKITVYKDHCYHQTLNVPLANCALLGILTKPLLPVTPLTMRVCIVGLLVALLW